MESLLIAAFGLLLLLTLGLVYLSFREGGGKRGPGPEQDLDDRAQIDLDASTIVRSKEMLQEMMGVLSGQVEGFVADARKYNRSLDHHREALQHANNMKSIKEIEQALLQEVETMRRANADYRSQLEQANRKIADQQKDLEQLAIDANVDFLTKVPNRRALDKRLFEEYERFRRGGNPFSLALIDIDRFKEFNDTHGHAVGDEVLRAVARMLNERRRTTDYVARYGGEEFAVVLTGTGVHDAHEVVERLREQIERMVVSTDSGRLSVTFSGGVAESLASDEGKLQLIQRADKRLYEAKEAGRNRVVADT